MKRIAHLFNRENSVRGASVILIVTLTISNILGWLRDRFLTKNIDTYHLDVYYAAFRIPDFIFNLFILGAIFSAFVPVFSEYLAKDNKKEGFKTANNLINLALLMMVLIGVILAIFMPLIVPLLVRFDTKDRLDQAVLFSRILLILPIFFSASYILGAMLNCFKLFFVYSLSPLFYNLAIIIGAIYLAPLYGVSGVVYAVVAGAFLHLIILIPSIGKTGYRYRFSISLADKDIRKIISLMIPRSISMGANQIMLSVFTSLASVMAAGSITAFSIANNTQSVPFSIVGAAFSGAIFPTLAMKIAQKKKKEFAFYLNRALRVTGYLLIPSTAIFILLRAQIIRLLYGSGKFNWHDTKTTALVLGLFAISILAQGIVPILARAFYAMKDTKTPMFCAILTVIVSIVSAIPLSKYYSVAGLALAFSIGNYINLFSFDGNIFRQKDISGGLC
jgi:putative peptidoglycan lipid II flippase